MLDAVSSVGRTGGLGENRRVDHAQNYRAAQESAAVEAREKVAAAAVAAISQPQPAQQAERPQVDARPTTAVYLSDTGGRSEEASDRAGEVAAEKQAAQASARQEAANASQESEEAETLHMPTHVEASEAAAEEDGIAAMQNYTKAYAADSAENRKDMIARMSQLVQKLYELPV
ncbi:MAG: hypothetical protein P8Y67_03485 [Alphaproteobacteria bacterium]